MIKVEVKEENNFIKYVRLTGHANYDLFGKDIVCASASSIVITTINGILMIDDGAIWYDDTDGVTIKVLKENDIVQKLLINMLDLLKELAGDYEGKIKFL